MGNTAINSRSKRLARNTLYLYGQMLVQLLVSLFTTRVVLDTLGKSDYGIFTVVGGVMSMFVVLNSIESATMRFISFEQGSGSSTERMHTVFSTARIVHYVIAALILILAETVGIYYVCNYLVLPPERLTAAIVAFQFSILTAIINVVCAPYDALIVAHERMGVFASIGIYNVLANLIIAFLVKYTSVDKLMLYAALVMMVQVSMRLIYGWYCHRCFPETRGGWQFDRQLFVKILKFGGWTFNGTLATIGYTQGINLLFNLFYGTLLNAAFGIAYAVQDKVSLFADKFLAATRPQIVKSYASGEMDYLHKLIINSSRFSVMLMFLIALPLILETHFVLFVWLGYDIPDYTVWFVRLALMMATVNVLAQVMCITIHATGRIARFQMIEANLLLLIVPMAAWLLWKGYSPIWVMIGELCMFGIIQIVRVFIVCPAVNLSIMTYMRDVILRSLLVIVTGSIPPVLVHVYGGMHEHPLTQVVCVTAVSLLSACTAIYSMGLDNEQRAFVRSKLTEFLHQFA